MKKVKVAIYCRISPFADELTLTRLCEVQKSVLIEKATASNFEVVDCYADVGYAGDDPQRPDLQRLLQDYVSGKFAIVLVINKDRLIKGNYQKMPKLPFPILSAQPMSKVEYER